MSKNDRERTLLGAVDGFLSLVALVVLVALVAIYLDLRPTSLSQLQPKDWQELFKDVIANLIPVPLLFLVSYLAYRRIQTIRSRYDTEILSETVASSVVAQLSSPMEKIDDHLARLDIDSQLKEIQTENYKGVVAVHRRLYPETFEKCIKKAQNVTILNTWIPDLPFFRNELQDAAKRKANIRILLLYPNSEVAELRNEALQASSKGQFSPNVKLGVENCLDTLREIVGRLTNEEKQHLKIKLYNSMPSISVYSTDDRYYVGLFLHGQLAIESPQFEVHTSESVLGQHVMQEVETLWGIGKEIKNIENWRSEIDLMAQEF